MPFVRANKLNAYQLLARLRRELWPHTPRAGEASVAVLLGALVVAGPQAARVLWNWPLAHAGPRWLSVLFAVGARAAAVGLLVLEALGVLALVASALASV